MRIVTPGELLDTWEVAAGLPNSRRSVALLRAIDARDGNELSQLSVGEQDRLLLELRTQLFGWDMAAVKACPTCQQPLEVSLPMAAFLDDATKAEEIEVRADAMVVLCRPLRAADLADAATTGTLQAARNLLIERAVVRAEHNGEPIDAARLPARVVAAVAAAVSEADPLANIELPLTCDACGTGWTASLDVTDYLWQEIDTWAWRLLSDVSLLAREYGWNEREILDLSPQRRRRYLELINDG
jgi:hypothetical protein